MTLTRELLVRCTFPEPDTAVSCAVSGGADSLALLVLARSAGCCVTAVHVDHGLRAESSAEANVVADACARFGAEFVGLTVELQPGSNLEARARAARYAALPAGVLTGHTADDQAETVLINMLRGSALSGLSGMRREGHPILSIRRSETHALCDELGLTPVQDPSNSDPSILRNRVRHELMGLLDNLANRDVSAVIARQSDLVRDDADLLDSLSEAIDPTDALMLRSAPEPLARRAIRRWVRSQTDAEHHPPDASAVERVLAVARGEAKSCDVINGLRVTRTQQRLKLQPTRATR